MISAHQAGRMPPPGVKQLTGTQSLAQELHARGRAQDSKQMLHICIPAGQERPLAPTGVNPAPLAGLQPSE